MVPMELVTKNEDGEDVDDNDDDGEIKIGTMSALMMTLDDVDEK